MENSRLVGKINKRLSFMLHLAKDGIFPIVKDAAGHPLRPRVSPLRGPSKGKENYVECLLFL